MTQTDLGPVVSSAHLADGRFPELSEFEFGMILAGNSFQRWCVRAMAAAGYDLSTIPFHGEMKATSEDPF